MRNVPRLSTVLLIILTIALLATPASAAPLPQQGISHQVKIGDTLTAIARQYGISVRALMDANNIENPSLIYTGQMLFIPGQGAWDGAASGSQAVAPSTGDPVAVHVVKPGETLTSIAAQHEVSLAQLVAANRIQDPSRIRSGTELVIPGAQALPAPAPAPAASLPESAEDSPRGTVYVVQAGETLSSIARQHDTTVAALAAANQLSDPSNLSVGQSLVVPSNAAPPPAQALQPGQLSMTVSIAQQRCWVYSGQTLLYNWPCSTGRAGSTTKIGTFYVQSKIREAWGSVWGFYMPYWLGIYWAGGSENGIHGLPYEPGGYPIWGSSVGTPVTYGCVLLGAEESRTLWEMAYIGMPVTIQP